MGGSQGIWQVLFSRQQRFMRVFRQSKPQESLEEAVLEDSREEIIDRSRQEVEYRHCPV